MTARRVVAARRVEVAQAKLQAKVQAKLDAAATTVQCAWRMCQALVMRGKLAMLRRDRAVALLQCAMRRSLAARRTRQRRDARGTIRRSTAACLFRQQRRAAGRAARDAARLVREHQVSQVSRVSEEQPATDDSISDLNGQTSVSTTGKLSGRSSKRRGRGRRPRRRRSRSSGSSSTTSSSSSSSSSSSVSGDADGAESFYSASPGPVVFIDAHATHASSLDSLASASVSQLDGHHRHHRLAAAQPVTATVSRVAALSPRPSPLAAPDRSRHRRRDGPKSVRLNGEFDNRALGHNSERQSAIPLIEGESLPESLPLATHRKPKHQALKLRFLQAFRGREAAANAQRKHEERVRLRREQELAVARKTMSMTLAATAAAEAAMGGKRSSSPARPKERPNGQLRQVDTDVEAAKEVEAHWAAAVALAAALNMAAAAAGAAPGTPGTIPDTPRGLGGDEGEGGETSGVQAEATAEGDSSDRYPAAEQAGAGAGAETWSATDQPASPASPAVSPVPPVLSAPLSSLTDAFAWHPAESRNATLVTSLVPATSTFSDQGDLESEFSAFGGSVGRRQRPNLSHETDGNYSCTSNSDDVFGDALEVMSVMEEAGLRLASGGDVSVAGSAESFAEKERALVMQIALEKAKLEAAAEDASAVLEATRAELESAACARLENERERLAAVWASRLNAEKRNAARERASVEAAALLRETAANDAAAARAAALETERREWQVSRAAGELHHHQQLTTRRIASDAAIEAHEALSLGKLAAREVSVKAVERTSAMRLAASLVTSDATSLAHYNANVGLGARLVDKIFNAHSIKTLRIRWRQWEQTTMAAYELSVINAHTNELARASVEEGLRFVTALVSNAILRAIERGWRKWSHMLAQARQSSLMTLHASELAASAAANAAAFKTACGHECGRVLWGVLVHGTLRRTQRAWREWRALVARFHSTSLQRALCATSALADSREVGLTTRYLAMARYRDEDSLHSPLRVTAVSGRPPADARAWCACRCPAARPTV